MLLNFLHTALAKPARALVGASLMLALAACGGGGGSPGSTGPGTGTPGTGTPGTGTPVTEASATVTLVDAAGKAVTSLTGVQTATARAVFKNAKGEAAAGVIVKFTMSEPLLTLDPASGSVLTDAAGLATVTIKPDASKPAGAVSVTATATVETKTVSASANIAVGASSAVVSEPTLALTVVGAGNVAVANLSGNQSATVRAVIKDSAGNVSPNTIVQFELSNDLLVFTPSSGSALTDAAGVATIGVTPSGPAAAGATAITATAVVAGKTATATSNMAIAAAALTVNSIAVSPAPVGALPAGNSTSLNIAITSGGQPALGSTGLVLSSLCVADGTATLTMGPFANGVQTATYLNKGCNRGTDSITASIGASTLSTALIVDPSSIGTILFLSSDPADRSIVLKGSGGVNRQESALLTFRVVDQNNVGLAGVPVSFAASTATGGLTVLPANGTTDAQGNVTTTVSSGTIPTPVRVLAQASRAGKTITGLSDTLIISTGLPIQKSMSFSADTYNMHGWNKDGTIAKVSVRMADQYGNPIADNTAVNFVTEGGAIGTPALGGCVTVGGGCTVELKSQAFRPSNGRVTVLAYVQGIEDFIDSNGDGQYSCTNFTAPDGSVPAIYRPLIDTCVSGGEPFTDMGDPFLDAGFLGSVQNFHLTNRFSSLDGSYDSANGDLPFPYNRAVYAAAGNGKWGLNFIRATAEITFSDSAANLEFRVCDAAVCGGWKTGGVDSGEVAFTRDAPVAPATVGECTAKRYIQFRVYDLNNNPMPLGTKLTMVNMVNASAFPVMPDEVGSTSIIGGTYHSVTITPPKDCKAADFAIQVEAPTLKTIYSFFSRAVAP